MRVYVIAPAPSFDRDTLMSDKVLHTDTPYTIIAHAGIATVAAYFSDDFEVRLCDELVQAVDFDDPADVICISMTVAQVKRGLEIAQDFRNSGKTVIVGGPHVSLDPDFFEGKADSIFVGEIEGLADKLVSDLQAGCLKPRYTAPKPALTNTRLPRWDLYPNERAVWGVVQTSRGCPFECDFCDVIQYLGRVQRHKPAADVVNELQHLYDHGYRQVHLSDDNFTVYRKRTREMLAALEAWNGREGRDPVIFMTQASVDLSRDEDLLAKCNRAGVRDIFYGIETDNEESLAEAKKRQNLRQDLVAQVEKTVRAGLYVTSGMMVGFDSDRVDCFERQFRFAMSLPVVLLRVTVLVASYATPLYARMQAEGRLIKREDFDPYMGGDLWSNIEPMNMTRKELAEGASWLINALIDPDNAIPRFERMAALLGPAPDILRRPIHQPYRQSGRAASLAVMQKAARHKGARRVMEAVRDLAHDRPEIAADLNSTLASYLNTYISLHAYGARGTQAEPAYMMQRRGAVQVPVSGTV